MTELKTLRAKKIVQVCCGPNSCTALANDGVVYTFGCGRQEAGSEKDGNATSVNLLGRGRSLRYTFLFFSFLFPFFSFLDMLCIISCLPSEDVAEP